jgi:hypothetical protein
MWNFSYGLVKIKLQFFSLPSTRTPYNLSMDLHGVCGPQVKNSCNRWWNFIVSFLCYFLAYCQCCHCKRLDISEFVVWFVAALTHVKLAECTYCSSPEHLLCWIGMWSVQRATASQCFCSSKDVWPNCQPQLHILRKPWLSKRVRWGWTMQPHCVKV